MGVKKTLDLFQVVQPDADIIIAPAYTSDHSRSPSLNRQRFSDINNEYSYRHDIPSNEIIVTPRQQHFLVDNPSLTTSQILAQKSPLLPSSSTHPSVTWKATSSSSLNNSELRPKISFATDTDVPKLNTPLIPYGSTSSRTEIKRPDFQSRFNDKYNSSSSVHNSFQPDQSYRVTYGSLPDAEILPNDNFNSLKPILSNSKSLFKYILTKNLIFLFLANGYPGLTAIIQHHEDPSTVYYNENSPLNPHRGVRFDTSTTTNDFQWSHGAPPSPPAIHHHDGYIRPLTPQKSIQPDIIHDRLPLNYHHSEPPVVYRSSTTVYTKDKRNIADSGRIQTWSVQENDRKPITSFSTSPPKVYRPQEEEVGEERYHVSFEQDQPYYNNRYPSKKNKQSLK
jgi:hypothetical protein